MSIPNLRIIVALDEEGGFAKKGEIPWNFPQDFAHFQKATQASNCIMGRRTAEDILSRNRRKEEITKMYEAGDAHLVKHFELLPGRNSIVLSRNSDLFIPGAEVASDLSWALERIVDSSKPTYILGGEKLFVQALPMTKFVTVTCIPGIWDCDRKFPLKYLMENFRIVEGKKLKDELKVAEYRRIR